jgi:ABC-type transport system involved in multi-copper enzyme maturation permease subunit
MKFWNKPESIPEARLRVKPRLRSFLLTGLLIGLMVFGGGIITVLVMGMIALFAGFSGQRGSPQAIVFVLFIHCLNLLFSFWLYLDLLLVVALADLAIAIERRYRS